MISAKMSGAIFHKVMNDDVKLSILIALVVTTCFDLRFNDYIYVFSLAGVSSCVFYLCP